MGPKKMVDETGCLITLEARISSLKKKMVSDNFVRILEAHNGLSCQIVDSTKIVTDTNVIEFDVIWLSSLCDSAIKCKPDIGLLLLLLCHISN